MIKLGSYRNGNYNVTIYDDGTKIRETDADEFVAEFPENIDVKLTDRCSCGCPWCYEGCTPNGEHSVIDFNGRFLNSLRPYTEIALNGNDMNHPQLDELLNFLKSKKIIANITVNQKQLMDNLEMIMEYQNRGLLYGIGVSLVEPNDAFFDAMSKLKNGVVHTIVGVLSKEQIERMKNRGLKLLLLGYKNLKRGETWKTNNKSVVDANRMYVYFVLPKMLEWFDVVSFDNLAIEQLNVKRILSDEEWNEFYMGDDGQHTFYVDLVKKEYGKNSLSSERKPMLDMDVVEMFSDVKQQCENSHETRN